MTNGSSTTLTIVNSRSELWMGRLGGSAADRCAIALGDAGTVGGRFAVGVTLPVNPEFLGNVENCAPLSHCVGPQLSGEDSTSGTEL